MAAMVPLRVFWSNWINGLATIRAVGKYASARLRGHALSWTKTRHEFPTRAALLCQALKIGEILVQNRIVPRHVVEQAEQGRGSHQRLGEHLIGLGVITEQQLYEALGLQQQLPLVEAGPLSIPHKVARALPMFFTREWKVVPFAIDEHGVHLCTPDPPTEELTVVLRRHTGLAIHFHLIPRSRFEALASAVTNSKPAGNGLSMAAGV